MADDAVEAEEELVGDGVTPGIVRIGDTVRRPARPFTATVQACLAHLHEAGFPGALVPLGVDEAWIKKAAPLIAARLTAALPPG